MLCLFVSDSDYSHENSVGIACWLNWPINFWRISRIRWVNERLVGNKSSFACWNELIELSKKEIRWTCEKKKMDEIYQLDTNDLLKSRSLLIEIAIEFYFAIDWRDYLNWSVDDWNSFEYIDFSFLYFREKESLIRFFQNEKISNHLNVYDNPYSYVSFHWYSVHNQVMLFFFLLLLGNNPQWVVHSVHWYFEIVL